MRAVEIWYMTIVCWQVLSSAAQGSSRLALKIVCWPKLGRALTKLLTKLPHASLGARVAFYVIMMLRNLVLETTNPAARGSWSIVTAALRCKPLAT